MTKRDALEKQLECEQLLNKGLTCEDKRDYLQNAKGRWCIYHVQRHFDASPDFIRTMHNNTGSVFRVNRGQQKASPVSCTCML